MGKIICIEGISGSGKTTQINFLYDFLSPDAAIIPEFNSFSPFKEVIEEWKKEAYKSQKIYFEKNDIIKFAKARRAVQKNILQKVSGYNYLLADRSVYTSLVYEEGEVKIEEIEEINRLEGIIFPDEGFILDCKPEEALSRIDKRREKEGLYRSRSIHETLEELKKRRELYLKLPEKYPGLHLLDSSEEECGIFKKIKEILRV